MAFAPVCLLVFVLGCTLLSPVLSVPSLPSTVRNAVYEDISTTYNLVYAVKDSSCPSSITFGTYTFDEREFPILPFSDIEEDETECSGDGSLNFVTERTVNEPGLLEALKLQSFQEAISENGNAGALIDSPVTDDLLVGWHSGTRTCGSLSYPTQTIYFVIREDKDYKITFRSPEASNRVNIPPGLRSLLIVAPNNQVCLLIDKSTNPDQDVTLLTGYSNGTVTNSQLTTAGIVELPPPSADSADEGDSSSSANNGGEMEESSAASDDTMDETSDEPPSPSPAPEPSASSSLSPFPSVSPSASVAPDVDQSAGSVAGGGLAELPSASPAPSVASGVASVAPSPSDFGALVASPSAIATAVPLGSPIGTVAPGASAVPPGAAGAISFEDDPVASAEEDDGSACFPASAIVRTERGDLPMHQVEIGDRVSTGNGFSDVVLFTHRRRVGTFAFTRLRVKSGRDLTVSDGHYVLRKNGHLVAASSVAVGDVLRMSDESEDGSVVKIEKVFEAGLYNPQTESGSIVVNGFVASTYTTAVDPRMAHTALLLPVRLMYKVWRWPVEQLSLALDEGSRIARWMPRGEAVVVGL